MVIFVQGQETLMVIFIVGAWTSHTIVYVPALVNRREAVPFVLTFEIVPFCGPFEIRTLCGSLPVQTNFTVSPRLMLSFCGPTLICGPTFTDFVAANAGMATYAAATAAIATSTAMRRFMVASCLLIRWGRSSASSALTSGDAP